MLLALALMQTPALARTTRVVQCRDGKWVKSAKACRHRGGLRESVTYYRSGTSRRPPRARCRDGSVQTASARTCRHRGGVSYWM